MQNSLFRKQAVDYQKTHLRGAVLVLPAWSHSLIALALLLWLGIVIVWLISSDYARKETVSGWLEPPQGVVRVFPQSARGQIKQILVSEGQAVRAGQALFVVNGDNIMEDGLSMETQMLRQYERQQTLLEQQLLSLESSKDVKLSDIQERLDAAASDLVRIESQIDTLDALQALLRERERGYRSVTDQGHLSALELDRVIERQLAVKNERQALLREHVQQSNLIQQLTNQQALLPQEHMSRHAELHTRLSELSQLSTQLEAKRTHIVHATRAGVVTNLQARIGQQTQADLPLLTLLPTDGRIQAKILVPVRASGFVSPGQPIQLRYEAFPYQKHGFYQAEIISMSKAVLLPNEVHNTPLPIKEPTYLVLAELQQLSVQAYGKRIPLKSGMTFSADVQLGERTLFEWLLEPVLSLQGRL